MLDLNDVDEVWLALDTADSVLRRSGHRPTGDQITCAECYALSIIVRGMEAYRQRIKDEECVTTQRSEWVVG